MKIALYAESFVLVPSIRLNQVSTYADLDIFSKGSGNTIFKARSVLFFSRFLAH